MQLLSDFAERYILSCRAASSEAKKHSRFPNIAGFCRFCGIGSDQLNKLKEKYPNSYSALCLILEDEALNAEIPASILSAYLKKRLGYGDTEGKSAELTTDEGQIKLIFEHDILSDGE